MENDNLVSSDSEKSDISDDQYWPYNVVDSLQHSMKPTLTKEEYKFMNTYSYDKEPVEEWREVSDFDAIKECNEVMWEEISKLLGDCHSDHHSSWVGLLCDAKSKVVNTIEKIICKNGCYFFPAKCFMKHGYELKNLMKKSLHDQLNPNFEKLFENLESKEPTLELTEYGAPMLFKLAKDIGITTTLDYDKDGVLKIDFSVLTREFWYHTRPSYVKELKKILDIVYAILFSTKEKHDEEFMLAKETYTQTQQGLNDPVLKTMLHGPDYGIKETSADDVPCDIVKDEKNFKLKGCLSVEHKDCKSFNYKDHWEHKHHPTEADNFECTKCDSTLHGPASNKKAHIFYPCNKKQCWVGCKCKFCEHVRKQHCEHHTKHIKHSTKDCPIQQEVLCQEHWIDHPENLEAGDIEIEKNLLFHNGEVKKDGQIYFVGVMSFPGLRAECDKCKDNTLDHLQYHLTPHLQCKHCMYELKTAEDSQHWKKVCKICGKKFFSEHLKLRHLKRHDLPKQICSVCGKTFSSKYNVHRHMIEQHNAMQQLSENFECYKCEKVFLTKGSLGRHLQGVHRERFSQFENPIDKAENANTSSGYKCYICDSVFTRNKTLQEHQNQHNKESSQTCEQCGKSFSTVSYLKKHMKIHDEEKQFKNEKYRCEYCGKHFTTGPNLKRHVHIHTGDQKHFKCNVCDKSYVTKSKLDAHISSVHENKVYSCDLCENTYNRLDTLKTHKNKSHEK